MSAGGLFKGTPHLRPDEHRLLSELIRARLGLDLGVETRALLERRLGPRLAALGLSSFADYEMHLRFAQPGDDEWDHVTEILTVHETYFFRQPEQLRALSDELFPVLHERKANRRRLAIWSAACASGEEVYTLGILVRQSGLFVDWDVRIYGSDISKKCIATARRGVYGESAFRTVSAESLAPNVRRVEGKTPATYEVSSSVRGLCHFGQLNLVDPGPLAPIGHLDIILCRNLLIYFDERARRRAIELFYERLAPGGILVLGHAESLLHVSTDFELLHLQNDLVYNKPLKATT